MNKIVFAFMLLLANVAIAQPSVLHGVSLQSAHLNEEIEGEYTWNKTIPMDFPVIMHVDTITMKFPYHTKRFVNGKYRQVNSNTDEWTSIDEEGNQCWVYLIDEDEATYIRVEYLDRAYHLEIQLYD